MMNIINTLTIKHMLENKRRSLVTIFGIIISVAMFVAVTTFASSFLKMLQNEHTKYNGEWHVGYFNITDAHIQSLKTDTRNQDVIPIYQIDTVAIDDANDSYIPLDLASLDSHGFEKMVYLEDGEYPKNDTEIIIPQFLTYTNTDLKIGGTISLYSNFDEVAFDTNGNPIKTEDNEIRTYTIVGICNDRYHLSYDYLSPIFTYTTVDTISNSQSISAFVTLESVSNTIYNTSEEVAQQFGITEGDIRYSEGLLFYGVSNNNEFKTTMYTIIMIVMVIIMIGSIMLIYNAFAISLSERKRHLGMLTSIGTTKLQKQQSVFFEGFILGVIAIPLGLIVGIGGMGITFASINPIIKNISDVEGFPLTVSFEGIAFSVFFATLTIFISTYVPARQASKITAMEALRSSQDIKISKRKVRTSKLTKLLFNFEGELALKNLKRNKKRYYITVISLIVSVILFLSVSSFTYYFKNAFNMTQQRINFDAYIRVFDDSILPTIPNLKNTTESVTVMETSIFTSFPIEAMTSEALHSESAQWARQEDRFNLDLSLTIYDDAYLDTIYEQHNIAPGSIVFNNAITLAENRKFTDITILKPTDGDISFSYMMYDNEEEREVTSTWDNVVFSNVLPIGVTELSSVTYVQVIMSTSTFEALHMPIDYSTTTIYYTSDDPLALDEEVLAQQDLINSGNISYYNVTKDIQSTEQVLLIINVFAYGFIALISLISIANIFNTITTSVSLRTKEFSMLRSVGMTAKAFNKMIYFESVFYGMHTLLFAIPISIGIMYWMHTSLISVFDSSFTLPVINIIIVIIAVFMIVGITLLFSVNKIKKQNIIDGLRTDNI